MTPELCEAVLCQEPLSPALPSRAAHGLARAQRVPHAWQAGACSRFPGSCQETLGLGKPSSDSGEGGVRGKLPSWPGRGTAPCQLPGQWREPGRLAVPQKLSQGIQSGVVPTEHRGAATIWAQGALFFRPAAGRGVTGPGDRSQCGGEDWGAHWGPRRQGANTAAC